MLIGKTITIREAKNRSIEGKHGTVIDETKNTITIRTTDITNKKHTDITIIKDQLITIEEQP
jgi:RNase P/RNase MRP subunit p29